MAASRLSAMVPTTTKMLHLEPIYQKILAAFPNEIHFAFAYGSGVFPQTGKADTKGKPENSRENMIDVVLIVDDALQFHSLNLKTHWKHYSLLKWGGPGLVAQVQRGIGAGVYYNTLVPFEDRLIKYGVASKDTLVADLLDWETLYLSGRLHKPVLILKEARDAKLKSALRMNLHNAAHTALLLLPETFTEEELYRKITELSYVGDFRMWIGEDKDKVRKIVRGNEERFRRLYVDVFEGLQHVRWNREAGTIEQDYSPAAKFHHLNLLPKHLQLHLYKCWYRDGRQRDLEEVLKTISRDIDCELVVREGVEHIVWRSSWSQSLKGVLTAGVLKSARYSAAKLRKMFRSSRKESPRDDAEAGPQR